MGGAQLLTRDPRRRPAGRAGYADQAHLSREAQRLSGQTALTLRRD